MSPHRETGTCGCVEHQAADRLRQIIKEKDEEIVELQALLAGLQALLAEETRLRRDWEGEASRLANRCRRGECRIHKEKP